MFFLSDYKTHYKQIIRLGGPIMLGQLGIIIVGFADNIMVGHHLMEELAAASFVNNFFTLASIFGIGFSYGLTPVISEHAARKEWSKGGSILKNSLFVNFLVGLGITLAMTILLFNVRRLNQPEELIPLIIPYFILQLVSIPFVMLFNAFKQFSEGIGDTVTPMWILLGTNVLFANALRGITDVKFLAWSAFICHFGLALPIGYINGFVLGWGALGVWSGFPVSLTALGLLLFYRFNRKTNSHINKLLTQSKSKAQLDAEKANQKNSKL